MIYFKVWYEKRSVDFVCQSCRLEMRGTEGCLKPSEICRGFSEMLSAAEAMPFLSHTFYVFYIFFMCRQKTKLSSEEFFALLKVIMNF